MATTTTQDTEEPKGTKKPEFAEVRRSVSSRVAGWRYLGLSALLFAVLQALCPAISAISAIRVMIGVGALAVAAGTNAPPRGWHADWIRIPVMLIAAFGAALNLFVIWHVRRLRSRPAAQWRVQPPPASKMRSERLQIALALLTFAVLAAEQYVHSIIYRAHY
jgi:hypothetical protein